MNDFLDDIEKEEEDFESNQGTELPESPARTLEEEEIFQFKKNLFKHTRLSGKKISKDSEDLYDESYWYGEISTVIKPDSDLIVCKDGRRLQEYIIDCLIDYLNKGINAESTPAFTIHYLLQDMGLTYSEVEKAKIALYEEKYNEFCHKRD